MKHFTAAALLLATLAMSASTREGAQPLTGSCFLLYEVGVGEVSRSPGKLCESRLLPASTFKIPHALAALDAGVVQGPDTVFKYDGSAYEFESWRRDHTLLSAMHNSVVWYFQQIATRLGVAREHEYLERFDYGNAFNPKNNLTRFWLDGTLRISPVEQLRFLRRLYTDDLPVRRDAMRAARQLLVQPEGKIVNARGEHPFAAPWPAGVTLSAKTGSGAAAGQAVRWIVGHVTRQSRSWIFVSCIAGNEDVAALAAVDQAASELIEARVLR